MTSCSNFNPSVPFNVAAGFDPRFATVFPTDTDEEKHLFDLLRRAYVDARYSKRYAITEGELEAIAGRVEELKGLTGEVCEARIGRLTVSTRGPNDEAPQ